LAFRTSLARPIQLAGGDRRLIGFAAFGGTYLGFVGTVSYGMTIGITIGIVITSFLFWLALQAGKSDPHLLDVWWRHSFYRRFYPARGRFVAILRNYRE
jgi:type IV secretory pathway TrbD component